MKKAITVISLLSASIILTGCGKTSTSENTAPEKESEQTIASIASSETETTTTAAATETVSATTAASTESNTEQSQTETTTIANTQNSGDNSSDSGAAYDQGSASAGRYDQGYQEKYQNALTKMVDEAVAGGGKFFIDYTLKDLTDNGVPELIVKHGDLLFNTVITIYNSDMKVIGDGFRGSDTAFYENTNGELAFVTMRMGMFNAMYPTYDAASDSVVTGNVKDASYGSFDEVDGLLQNEGLKSLAPVSITVDSGTVRSEYRGQNFDYPYFGIIV